MMTKPVGYWDTCGECEHYRSEHTVDGSCKCIVVADGEWWVCTCAAFELGERDEDEDEL